MVNLFLDILNKVVNAIAADSADAARQLLTAQQTLEACRNANNPGLPGNSWIQGARMQGSMWAPDPCQAEQDQVQALVEQGAAEGNQVATQQLGSAPAPQLTTSQDPVPNLDPAIPASEFVTPTPGANNMYSPLGSEELMEILMTAMREHPIDEDIIMELVDPVAKAIKYYQLWCPWGGPGVDNLKWSFKYKPKNSDWMGKWAP